MENDHTYLQELLEKYLEERPMSAEELRSLQTFIQDEQYSSDLDTLLKEAFNDTAYREEKGIDPAILFQRIQDRQALENRKSSRHSNRRIRKWYTYAAAAIVLALLSIGLYVYTHRAAPSVSISEQWAGRDIDPGGNKAYLTLTDGRRVPLSEEHAGIRLSEDGVAYLDGSSLEAVLPSEESTVAPVQLQLTTPKGGQYQVVLPDGTRVWLNAASTLSYPSRFTHTERRVTLQGEGYFEVAHQAAKPFIVATAAQDVKVLGTHFNIQAYTDENRTTTTLLEGSVQVAAQPQQNLADATRIASEVLKPNQQSVLETGKHTFHVATVDPVIAVAWKNGLFQFENATIQTVMRAIARWYDLEIEYKGRFKDERFNGKVYRDMTLGQVLDVLSFSKIHFELEGQKLLIYPSVNN